MKPEIVVSDTVPELVVALEVVAIDSVVSEVLEVVAAVLVLRAAKEVELKLVTTGRLADAEMVLLDDGGPVGGPVPLIGAVPFVGAPPNHRPFQAATEPFLRAVPLTPEI